MCAKARRYAGSTEAASQASIVDAINVCLIQTGLENQPVVEEIAEFPGWDV